MTTMSKNEELLSVLRNDPYSYVRAIFPIVTGETSLRPNWHLEAIAYKLSKVLSGQIKRLIITVPPRSLKSLMVSVAFPTFVLGHHPSRKIITVSYAERLAAKHANDSRILMRSDLYRRLFPSATISDIKDTELEIMTMAHGGRLATSVGGTITGRGGDLIIIDDPIKPQDAYSEISRQGVIDWYRNTALSRLDDKAEGAIILVMQRVHPEDLAGYLLEQGGWEHLNLPAIAEIDEHIQLSDSRYVMRTVGSALHPERESLEMLAVMEREMGVVDFAAQYQQSPVHRDGGMVKRAWIGRYDTPPPPRSDDRVIVSWDTASSNSELADYSACVVLLARGDRYYVLDVLRQRLEYPDLRRVAIQQHLRRRGSPGYTLLIEKAGAGLALIQDLQREGIPAIGVPPVGDKIMRMHAQTGVIEGRALHLPERAPWLAEFEKELFSFPVSRHDDQIDALSQALERARRQPPPGPIVSSYQIVG